MTGSQYFNFFKNKTILRLFLLSLFFPSLAKAVECDLSVLISSPNSVIYQDQSSVYEYTINLLKLNQEACEGRIGISSGLSNSYSRKLYNSTNSLNYNIYKTNELTQVIKDIPDSTTSSEYIGFSFAEGQNLPKQISFYLKIDNEQQPTFLKRAGTYSDVVNVGFYPTESTSSYKTTILNLSAQVSPLFSIRVGAQDQSYSSALASASLVFTYQNQTKSTSVYVLANDDYTLAFSSENGGKLVHPDNSNYSIQYLVTLNGNQINLSQPSSTSYNQVTESIGKEFKLNFSMEIDSYTLLYGSYTDTITVSVFPAE